MSKSDELAKPAVPCALLRWAEEEGRGWAGGRAPPPLRLRRLLRAASPAAGGRGLDGRRGAEPSGVDGDCGKKRRGRVLSAVLRAPCASTRGEGERGSVATRSELGLSCFFYLG